ncbi:uncharacterized protein G2W53_037097 [Senna tora]|uniref:Uncharacterized protein n=1 Tax=Senna tora TaxID=362788 RepID=A0A834SUS9_9FABA|nr:uncharacterized protein G2W53_037097 [Senna tora]
MGRHTIWVTFSLMAVSQFDDRSPRVRWAHAEVGSTYVLITCPSSCARGAILMHSRRDSYALGHGLRVRFFSILARFGASSVSIFAKMGALASLFWLCRSSFARMGSSPCCFGFVFTRMGMVPLVLLPYE